MAEYNTLNVRNETVRYSYLYGSGNHTHAMSFAQFLRSDDDAEVVAAIDRSGERALFLVADISTDEAWLATSQSEAVKLDSWQ